MFVVFTWRFSLKNILFPNLECLIIRASAVSPGRSEFLCNSDPISVEILPPSIRVSRQCDSNVSFFTESGIGILDKLARQFISVSNCIIISTRCE